MDIRRQIVTSIFNNWTALQLAVEHGFGSRHDALELVDFITQTLQMNDDIDRNEITDVLVEAMDAMFRTECEDNSCEEIGALLSTFAKYAKEENEDFVLLELNKLPKTKIWLSVPDKERRIKPILEEQPMDTEDDRISKSCDVDEEGWTEVKSRRH